MVCLIDNKAKRSYTKHADHHAVCLVVLYLYELAGISAAKTNKRKNAHE